MAIVLLVTGFAQAFMDMGISNAIIHRRDTTREQLTSLYWLNIFTGIVLFGLVVVCAPFVATFFEEPRLTGLTAWTALVFLIAPIGQQFQILLQKHLRFMVLGVVESLAAIVGAAVGIGSALTGQGVFSLVWGTLASTTVAAIAFLGLGLREWRPGFRFKKNDLAGYLGFGFYQVGERVMNYSGSRIDQLLIGSFLGTQILGYYSLAFNMAMLLYSKINPVLSRVAFPLLATIQEDNRRLTNAFMTMQQVLATVNFPILFGLAAIAPVFVSVVYGDQWVPAASLVQILALVAAIRSISNPTGSLLLAKGRADKSFRWAILFLITQLPAIYAGAKFGGSLGVAVALLIMQLVYYLLNYTMNIRPLIGPCLQRHIGSVTPAGLTGGLMALAVAGLPEVLTLDGIRLLAVQVVVGVFLYISLNWLFFRERTMAILGLALGRNT